MLAVYHRWWIVSSDDKQLFKFYFTNQILNHSTHRGEQDKLFRIVQIIRKDKKNHTFNCQYLGVSDFLIKQKCFAIFSVY